MQRPGISIVKGGDTIGKNFNKQPESVKNVKESTNTEKPKKKIKPTLLKRKIGNKFDNEINTQQKKPALLPISTDTIKNDRERFSQNMLIPYKFAQTLAGLMGDNDISKIWNGPDPYEDTIVLTKDRFNHIEDAAKITAVNNVKEKLQSVLNEIVNEDCDQPQNIDAPIKEEEEEEEEGTESEEKILPIVSKEDFSDRIHRRLTVKENQKGSELTQNEKLEEALGYIQQVEQYEIITDRLVDLSDASPGAVRQATLDLLREIKLPSEINTVRRPFIPPSTPKTVWGSESLSSPLRYFTPISKANIILSLNELRERSRAQDIILMDVMNETSSVHSYFAELVLLNMNIKNRLNGDIYSRNNDLNQLQTTKTILLRKMSAFQYIEDGNLVNRDTYNPILVRKRRQRSNKYSMFNNLTPFVY